MSCWICGKDGTGIAHPACLDAMNCRRDAGVCTACGGRPAVRPGVWCRDCASSYAATGAWPAYMGYGQ